MSRKIDAVMWFCGCTKTEAQKTIRKADPKWIEEIVRCFEDNARRSFYAD